MNDSSSGRRAPRPFRSVPREQIEALKIAEGYFGSQVLFALNELGVFALLAEGSRTASEVAAAIGVHEDPLERLMNAGVAIGLLRLSDRGYENTSLTNDVLLPGQPGYLGNWMRLMSRWMKAWTRITDTVNTGRPVVEPSLFLGGDADFTRDFIMAMDDYARLRGSEIVKYLELGGGLRLLDVGGGPGTYAIMFAQRWPDLRVDIFDLPEVVRIAERNIGAAGLLDRVSTVGGDYQREDLGVGYDVVFLSDVLHQETPEACEALIEKSYRAVRPGGRGIVQAMFLNEDRVSPRWPVMHSLILLAVYGGGRAYTVGETKRMLEKAGFRNIQHKRMSLLNVNSLLLADKPA
jgi:predicted O-methyltransferase YrrM